jgi:hypothetical protein
MSDQRGQPPTLADVIIGLGPFGSGDPLPGRLLRPVAADFNELRDELIAGRQARANPPAGGDT